MRCLLLLGLLAAPLAAQTVQRNEKLAEFKDFQKCGLITRWAPNLIDPSCFQKLTNFGLDSDWSLTRRLGYGVYNAAALTGSQSVRGLWRFFDGSGTEYLIALSSVTMYACQNGTCTPLPGGLQDGTLSPTANMECVQALGQLVCANGTNQPFSTNVASTQTLANAPIAAHVGTFRNRVLMAGVKNNQTRLYMSGQYSLTDYTSTQFPNLSTGSVVVDISGANDGQAIQCLMGEFQNQYLIGRKYDLYALSGYDNTNFTLRKVSNQIGCQDPKSVQEVNNVLHWLSFRGVEGLTGTEITRTSYPIDPTIAQVIAAAGNTTAKTLRTQADWQSGNLTASGAGAPVSATVSPNNLLPSSFTAVVQSTTDYAAGTFSSTTFQVTGVSVTLSSKTYDNTFANLNGWTFASDIDGTPTPSNNFSATSNKLRWLQGSGSGNGQGTLWANTTGFAYGHWEYDFSMDNANSVQQADTYFVAGSSNLTNTSGYLFRVSDNCAGTGGGGCSSVVKYFLYRFDNTYSSTVLLSSTQVSNANINGHVTIERNERGYISVKFANVPNITLTATDNTYSNGNDVAVYVLDTPQVSAQDAVRWNNMHFYDYYASGTYTSKIFDTSFTTPTVGPLSVSWSVPSDTQLSFSVRSSTSPNNDLWGAYQAINSTGTTTGTLAASMTSRYYQITSTFTNTVSTMTPSFTSETLPAETTAYYITPCVLVSTPTSWSNFTVDAVTQGGSLTFWISTGTTCGAAIASTATWNAQTANSVISVTTATTYIAGRVLFTLDTATEPVTLNDLSFSWNNGAFRPPTASAAWDDRYVLFYTTSTASGAVNDHAAILDQNGKWVLWDHVNAAAATIFTNQLFTGDANATGNIYTQNLGQSDNGGNFTAQFQTADFANGDPNELKQFNRFYIFMGTLGSNSVNVTLTCNYALDGSTVTYALGTVNLSETPEAGGYLVAKMPVPIGQPSTGHYVNLSCSYTGANGPLKLYEIRGAYSSKGWE